MYKKTTFKNRKKYICVFLCFATPIFLVASAEAQGKSLNQTVYTGSEIPGNPENGEKSLHALHKYLKLFQLNFGKYPSEDDPIVFNLIKHYEVYGFENARKVIDSLSNVDNEYNDALDVRINPKNMGIPSVFYRRPNGQNIGDIKANGEKDVIAFSDTYVHSNGGEPVKGRPLSNPVGFYLVLFEDETIEKVPYDKQYYVYNGGGEYGRNIRPKLHVCFSSSGRSSLQYFILR